MINNFKIENYKGIKKLSLNNIGQLNLFLGYNNCGKSSILEALYIFCDPSHPVNDIQINSIRHYLKTDKTSLKMNFHNLDVTSPITMTGNLDNGETRTLNINYFEEELNKTDLGNLKLTNLKSDKIYGIYHDIKISNNTSEKDFHFRIIPLNSKEANISSSDNSKEFKDAFNCGYMPPGNNLYDYITSFKELIENKEDKAIVNILNQIEPRLQSLALIDDQIMADIGISKLIPIQLLGDGIRKIFSIIIFLYQLRGGIALIDEVDNGLHYKSMPTLWNTIISMSKRYNIQLFITTHNIDSIKALTKSLTINHKEFQDKCEIYTVRKLKDNNTVAVRSTYSQLDYMINQEMELR